MALQIPRIQNPAAFSSADPGPARDRQPLPIVPAKTPAKPRDAALQERLKLVAAAKTEKRLAATTAADAAACKRRARRKSTALPGLITFRTMRLQIACTIADMSGTGARLVLPISTAQSFGDLEHLPDQLVLVIRTDRVQLDCEIKWRRVGSLGVRFLGPPAPLDKPQR